VWDFLGGMWSFLGGVWGLLAALGVASIIGVALFSGIALVIGGLSPSPSSGLPQPTRAVPAVAPPTSTPFQTHPTAVVESPPIFPTAPVSTQIPATHMLGASAELVQVVSNFLGYAAVMEARSYVESNDWYVSQVMTGEPLRLVQQAIANFRNQGVIFSPWLDFTQSRLVDIRALNANTLEVDACEWWGAHYYRALDGAYLQSDQVQLLPQTITIESSTSKVYITNVQFHAAPSFCG
ncbi:MAG: hypothetical protein ACRDH2_15315, partial [Anaerolineales bacterium]